MKPALCPLLKKAFGEDLKCQSPKETFTGLPILSERFSTSAAAQYYHFLPSLQNLVEYIQNKFCSSSSARNCVSQVRALLDASYVDIDFDTISHALVVNVYWESAPDSRGWNETIEIGAASDSVEVGVLGNEEPDAVEELKLGGFLTVIGEDSKPSATLFSFPSRHHPLPRSLSHQNYKVQLQHPTGLHPTLEIAIPNNSIKPPSDSCALHAYLTLPSAFFVDRYQLSDPLFLVSKNLVALRSLSGETDLEAPDWVVRKWGSAALIELAHPPSPLPDSSSAPVAGAGSEWTFQIPLHSRYLTPSPSGETNTSVPWPVVFWACTAEEGHKLSVNPFDRVNLGYEGLFGPRTMFYHLVPSSNAMIGSADYAEDGLVLNVKTPVLDLSRSWYVESGTIAVVMLGFIWVCWKLVGAALLPPALARQKRRGKA